METQGTRILFQMPRLLFHDPAQVDVRVLENDGNCSDAVISAAAAAMKTFKRPECLVVDGSVSVAAAADVSLTLHAVPVSVTFAVFQLANGEQVHLYESCCLVASIEVKRDRRSVLSTRLQQKRLPHRLTSLCACR